jgi:hypothetical protein
VPCSRSSRRVAVSAAWSLSDHSGSVLVRPPHLIRSQAKVTKRCPEGLAAVDRVEELRSYLGWEPLLRSGSANRSLSVTVRPTTEVAV